MVITKLMRYYIATTLILLIIVSVVGAEMPENKLDRDKIKSIKPIRPILINMTNITLNITDPINITNITEINVTDFNITDNSTNLTLMGELELINESLLLSPEEKGSTTYFYAGNKRIAQESKNGIKYIHNDRLDTQRLSTQFDGSEEGKIKTLPMGQEILNTNKDKFTFTGKELDGELYSIGARYYDSGLGKFTSRDPIEDGHKYNYVYNNPLRYTDPSGMAGVDKNQNVILNSPAMPIRNTPLILNFATQQEVEDYKKNIADPFIASANADTTGAQLFLDTGNGKPLSIPRVGESTVFPLVNLNMMGPLIGMEVRQDGPIENVVLMAHRNAQDHTQLVLSDLTNTRDTRIPMATLQTRVLALPDSSFANNAQMIFAICGADSCIDGQVIADSLGITTYLSNEKIEYVEGMAPMLIYGQFNEYTPSSTTTTK